MPRLRVAIGLSLLFAAGCQDAPPPAPPPPAEPEPVPPPAAAPAPEPAPPPRPEEPTRIVITARSFPQALLDKIKLDDLVEVELVRGGGRTRGLVKILRPGEIAVALEGTQIVTRLRPEDVKDVKLLFREDERLDIAGYDEPRNAAEGWLDTFAPRPIVEGQPADLWSGRFEANVALPVVRSLTLTTYSFTGRKGPLSCFAASSHRTTLREGDLVKLVGTVDAVEQRPGAVDRLLGEVQLYLLKRGGQVQALFSPDLLHASDLDRAAVQRFLEQEPVTFAAYKEGQDRRYVRIVRVPAKTARTYMLHLERTPERSALRTWRAQNNAGVATAEKTVRALYKAVGLTTDTDLEVPVVFELRTTSATGGLRLLRFRKELGID